MNISNSTNLPAVPEPQLEEPGGMSLLDHVREIRDRLFRCALALAIACAVSFLFAERVTQILIAPYGKELIFTTPFEALTSAFTVSITMAAAVTLPFIMYQFLAFIAPGLYDHEKRAIYWGIPFGTVLFIIGTTFAWYVLLPASVGFLTGIFPSVFRAELKADDYLPFVTGILFWMGAAFEMPLIIFLLAKANVLSGQVLAKNWRYAIVIIAILAAVITPTPDPLNMSLVMAPLVVLYGISIVLAFFARRNAAVPAFLDPEEKIKEK